MKLTFQLTKKEISEYVWRQTRPFIFLFLVLSAVRMLSVLFSAGGLTSYEFTRSIAEAVAPLVVAGVIGTVITYRTFMKKLTELGFLKERTYIVEDGTLYFDGTNGRLRCADYPDVIRTKSLLLLRKKQGKGLGSVYVYLIFPLRAFSDEAEILRFLRHFREGGPAGNGSTDIGADTGLLLASEACGEAYGKDEISMQNGRDSVFSEAGFEAAVFNYRFSTDEEAWLRYYTQAGPYLVPRSNPGKWANGLLYVFTLAAFITLPATLVPLFQIGKGSMAAGLLVSSLLPILLLGFFSFMFQTNRFSVRLKQKLGWVWNVAVGEWRYALFDDHIRVYHKAEAFDMAWNQFAQWAETEELYLLIHPGTGKWEAGSMLFLPKAEVKTPEEAARLPAFFEAHGIPKAETKPTRREKERRLILIIILLLVIAYTLLNAGFTYIVMPAFYGKFGV